MNDFKDRTAFIRNLSPDLTDDLIFELFLQAGPVESVKLKGDFGFVTFEDESSVPYACRLLNDILLCGLYLSVKPRSGSKFEAVKLSDAVPNRSTMMMAAQQVRNFLSSQNLFHNHTHDRDNKHTRPQWDNHSNNFGHFEDKNLQSNFSRDRPNQSSRDRSPVNFNTTIFQNRNPESSRHQKFASEFNHRESSSRDRDRREQNIPRNDSSHHRRDFNHSDQYDHSGRYPPMNRSSSYSENHYNHRRNSHHSSNHGYHHRPHNNSRDKYYY